jgi:uncharacterized NAD(P)/FAD-binding protein YdhS
VLTLGALRRGELWETTAVQEIRAQAEQLASTIEQSLLQAVTPLDHPSSERTGSPSRSTTRPSLATAATEVRP